MRNPLQIFSTNWLEKLRTAFLPPVGSVVQVNYVELQGILSAQTGNIPSDDTIPQITEGDEILSLVFTPKKVGNKLLILCHTLLCEEANTSDAVTASLFQDGGSDAIAVGATGNLGSSFNHGNIYISKSVTVASLSPITFSLRGGIVSGNYRVNAYNGTGAGIFSLGDKIVTFMRIEEIEQ